MKHIWWLLYLSCWRALKMPYICRTLKKLVPQNDCNPRDCCFSQGQDSKQVPPSFCINASQRAFPLTKGDRLEFNSMGQSGRTLKVLFFHLFNIKFRLQYWRTWYNAPYDPVQQLSTQDLDCFICTPTWGVLKQIPESMISPISISVCISEIQGFLLKKTTKKLLYFLKDWSQRTL